MAAKPVSITEPPNESALADTKHENQQKLAALAYEFWQARGCRDGTPEEDWFRAERGNAGSKRIDEKAVGSRDSAERSIDAEEADSPMRLRLLLVAYRMRPYQPTSFSIRTSRRDRPLPMF
jgi:hypothetical protein